LVTVLTALWVLRWTLEQCGGSAIDARPREQRSQAVGETGGEVDRGVIADRLNALFASSPNPDRRREWTLKEVSQGIGELGHEVSPSYIWRLRNGIARNPTLQHLRALAAFFKVPVAYFVDDDVADQVRAELRARAVWREIGLADAVSRGGGTTGDIGPDDLDEVRAFLDDIRQRHQPPPADENPGQR